MTHYVKIGILACCSLLLPFFAFGAESDPPITTGQRVFTIGHSFHVWVAPMLEEMAKSAGIQGHEIAGISSIGGSTIIMHWNVPDANNTAKAALIAGKVDVLTMSNIYLPDEGIEKFAKLAFEHNPNIRITMQEFWLPNDRYDPTYPLKYMTGIKVNHNAATMVELRKQHDLYFKDMDDMIRAVNKDLGKNVMLAVPVGQAVLALREKVIAGQAPGIKDQSALFSDDWGHATTPIQVLAAYCHFAVIYRRNPIGLPVPPELAAMGLPPDQAGALNLLLQQLAWDAVIHHPLSGVTAGVAP
jgi:hypothetical protein